MAKMNNIENTDEMINVLIGNEQYRLSQKEKEDLLVTILMDQVEKSKNSNEHIKSMLNKLDICKINSEIDVPYIPVQMFKKFDLATVERSEIIRVLKSSSTTGQNPSKVPLDNITASRQTKALSSTLRSYLGKKRRPFLVIDTSSVNQRGMDLTARGAAIRGLSTFAKNITYVLKEKDNNNELELDMDTLVEFCEKNQGKDIFVFGFTFMIWTKFVEEIERRRKDLLEKNVREKNCRDIKEFMNFSSVKIFHSGGWKKLKDKMVSEDYFSKKTAELFNIEPSNIHNFYGMAEQTGVIFIDCEEGKKHVPDFSDIIIRDPLTMEEVNVAETGLIEVLSVLGNSYYSQGLLTEDMGEYCGVDDCPCGRKGKYFVFKKRVEKTEIRGCGDTFADKNAKHRLNKISKE
jgi:hypothetical protein